MKTIITRRDYLSNWRGIGIQFDDGRQWIAFGVWKERAYRRETGKTETVYVNDRLSNTEHKTLREARNAAIVLAVCEFPEIREALG